MLCPAKPCVPVEVYCCPFAAIRRRSVGSHRRHGWHANTRSPCILHSQFQSSYTTVLSCHLLTASCDSWQVTCQLYEAVESPKNVDDDRWWDAVRQRVGEACFNNDINTYELESFVDLDACRRRRSWEPSLFEQSALMLLVCNLQLNNQRRNEVEDFKAATNVADITSGTALIQYDLLQYAAVAVFEGSLASVIDQHRHCNLNPWCK
jgi:hypothetical protein